MTHPRHRRQKRKCISFHLTSTRRPPNLTRNSTQAGHPFHVVLQKIPASSPHKVHWDRRVEAYAAAFPNARVVDLPSAVRSVANRETMLDAMRVVAAAMNPFDDSPSCRLDPQSLAATQTQNTVRAPRQIVAEPGTEHDLRNQCDAASLRFPLVRIALVFPKSRRPGFPYKTDTFCSQPQLAKSLRADGSPDSHKVAIVHDQDGLACIATGGVPGLSPPCVIQEYVNHGGCLFKVYVVGNDVVVTRRESLPDLRGARKANRRRRAAAEKSSAAERGDAVFAGAAGTSHGGSKPIPIAKRGNGSHNEKEKGKDDARDFDGDVDDSDADEDLEHEEHDETRRLTGAVSVSRISCFRGGATEGESSWRDRLTLDERLGMADSPSRKDTANGGHDGTAVPAAKTLTTNSSEIASPSPLPLRLLPKSFAKNLTITRIGSVDSIGGRSSGGPGSSVGHGLHLEGGESEDGDGDGRESSPAIGGKQRRSQTRVPPQAAAPGSVFAGKPDWAPPRSLHKFRGNVDAGSYGALSDFTHTTSDGGTESEQGELLCDDVVPTKGLRLKAAQDNAFRPDKESSNQRSNASEKKSSGRESDDGRKKNVVPAPGDAFVNTLALTLRDALALRLFNFDLIRVDGDKNEFLVVDINYFPGIAKMPGYCDAFCRFLTDGKRRV